MAVAGAALLGACAGNNNPLKPYDNQQDLAEAVRVPPGNQAVLEARGNGTLMYECQAVKRAPYEYQWLIRSPAIELTDSYGRNIKYKPGTHASWVASDGSGATAAEVVEVPNGSHSLPLQRYKIDKSGNAGVLSNISYVQRLRTVGGQVSVKPCSAPQLGMRMAVPYEADYVFWRPSNS